ncbi:MAG TPA: RNA polymerase sigma factor [Polyangia bacterium]|nr:RNA polymerase sigma factor [Polyangia bacterium]
MSQDADGRAVRDFTSVLRAHGEALFAHALYLTKTRADACDLFQDTAERAIRSLTLRVPDEKVRCWLFKIMKNVFVDRYRRAKTDRKHAPMIEILQPLKSSEIEREPEPLWCSFDARAIRLCARDLPPCMRTVFELHIDGCKYAEISARLGIPVQTVGTALFRARRRIRTLLLALPADEGFDVEVTRVRERSVAAEQKDRAPRFRRRGAAVASMGAHP